MSDTPTNQNNFHENIFQPIFKSLFDDIQKAYSPIIIDINKQIAEQVRHNFDNAFNPIIRDLDKNMRQLFKPYIENLNQIIENAMQPIVNSVKSLEEYFKLYHPYMAEAAIIMADHGWFLLNQMPLPSYVEIVENKDNLTTEEITNYIVEAWS